MASLADLCRLYKSPAAALNYCLTILCCFFVSAQEKRPPVLKIKRKSCLHHIFLLYMLHSKEQAVTKIACCVVFCLLLLGEKVALFTSRRQQLATNRLVRVVHVPREITDFTDIQTVVTVKQHFFLNHSC